MSARRLTARPVQIGVIAGKARKQHHPMAFAVDIY